MKDYYITKTDTNGNNYRLIIDHEAKKIIYNYSCPLFSRREATTTGKRDLQRLRTDYKKDGYTEV